MGLLVCARRFLEKRNFSENKEFLGRARANSYESNLIFSIKEDPNIHILKLSKARWFLILAVLSFEYTVQEVCSAALFLIVLWRADGKCGDRLVMAPPREILKQGPTLLLAGIRS